MDTVGTSICSLDHQKREINHISATAAASNQQVYHYDISWWDRLFQSLVLYWSGSWEGLGVEQILTSQPKLLESIKYIGYQQSRQVMIWLQLTYSHQSL